MSRLSNLQDAMRTRQLVRFSRAFQNKWVEGYVLDVGLEFFLLARVSDGIWFDGFACFRIAHVRDLKPAPYTLFVESALRKRRERKPKKPRVSLASLQELLISAGRAFPLVTIHREKIIPDSCGIGRVLGVNRGCVSLLGITPSATWDQVPESFRLSEITRVSFGGDYENALHLVGGEPCAS